MDFMNKLLDGIEVEWKMLGEVGEFIRGNGLQKSDFSENGIGCIHYGQIYTYYGNFATKTKSFVLPILAEKLRKAQKGNLIIATTSENIEDVCKPLVWLGEEEICVSGETYIFKHKQNPKYLAYYLQTPMFFDYKRKNRTGTKVIRVHGDKLAKFILPIPPLHIQEEIVRILDTFTELTAELTMRKQQYEYYETTLLFDSKHPRVLLKDVCTVNQGLQIPINQRKIESGENRYFYITVQFLKNNNEEKYYIENPNESVICNLDDILVTRTGSTGKIITGIHGCFHNNFFKVNCFNKINKRYMYYFLNSQVMFRKLLHTASGGTVPDLPHNKFYKLEIPLPPLEEQQRIVDILDKFDTLVNDIKEGLPAEIEARKKQYEYYRDKLLTFKNKSI